MERYSRIAFNGMRMARAMSRCSCAIRGCSPNRWSSVASIAASSNDMGRDQTSSSTCPLARTSRIQRHHALQRQPSCASGRYRRGADGSNVLVRSQDSPTSLPHRPTSASTHPWRRLPRFPLSIDFVSTPASRRGRGVRTGKIRACVYSDVTAGRRIDNGHAALPARASSSGHTVH